MTKVIIIDDEVWARNVVKEYLKDYPDFLLVDECADGLQGVKAIQDKEPDLIFLDIQMPKINGFEMLELIDSPPHVVFTTAYDDFAIKAFELNAVDYLLKPFSKDRFDKAILKYNEKNTNPQLTEVLESAALTPSQQGRIVVKDGSKIKIIPVSQIQYIESADDYAKIHTADGAYLKNRTMNFFEQSLEAYHFTRIHRSYIVNTQLITGIEPYEKDGHLVILSTGVKIPVSKSGYSKLKNSLGI
ncbi:MAG: LytR/AlgR family response regulator transcription factor [Ginsengibacter sp.]